MNQEIFDKWVKDIFSPSPKPEKRYTIVGLNFIKGYRKQKGDDELYSLLKSVNIMGGEDVLKYIEKFVKKYESKKK